MPYVHERLALEMQESADFTGMLLKEAKYPYAVA